MAEERRQFDGDNATDLCTWGGGAIEQDTGTATPRLRVRTRGGAMIALPGDWIVRHGYEWTVYRGPR